MTTLLLLRMIVGKRQGFLAGFVLLDDFPCPLHADGFQIGGIALFCCIGNKLCQCVALEEEIVAVSGLKHNVA